MRCPCEFTFDGTNKSLPAELRVMTKNEYIRVAGVPISNTRGRIIDLQIGKRYALLSSGKVVVE